MKLNLLFAFAVVLGLSGTAFAEDTENLEPKEPQKLSWTWEGPFGKFDRQQLQRGYQVYKEVCSACHDMHLLSFRNLSDPGGPGFSEAQVKALAAAAQIATLDDKGEPTQRAGTPADAFPPPFPNEKAARAANNNALPPDLSVIVKAREGGPDYVYSVLTGYQDAPPTFDLLPGLNYNPYFAGHQIAMPPPLTSDGQVTWPDGNPAATKEQMAKDVVAFLTWASEPKMEERKQLGVTVMIFLIVLAALLYLAYRRLWRDIDH